MGISHILDQSYLSHEEIVTSSTFPALGRYLLNDHIIFLGQSNSDHYLWGYGFDRNYFTERQIFLLGAKLDARYINDRGSTGHLDQPVAPSKMNPVLRQVIAERERVGWWSREPKYLGLQGVARVSEGFEVSRFVDDQGAMLIAVDNWEQRALLVLNIDQKETIIPCPFDPETGRPAKIFIFDQAALP